MGFLGNVIAEARRTVGGATVFAPPPVPAEFMPADLNTPFESSSAGWEQIPPAFGGEPDRSLQDAVQTPADGVFTTVSHEVQIAAPAIPAPSPVEPGLTEARRAESSISAPVEPIASAPAAARSVQENFRLLQPPGFGPVPAATQDIAPPPVFSGEPDRSLQDAVQTPADGVFTTVSHEVQIAAPAISVSSPVEPSSTDALGAEPSITASVEPIAGIPAADRSVQEHFRRLQPPGFGPVPAATQDIAPPPVAAPAATLPTFKMETALPSGVSNLFTTLAPPTPVAHGVPGPQSGTTDLAADPRHVPEHYVEPVVDLIPTAAGMTVPQAPEMTGYQAVAPTARRQPAAPGASLEPASLPTAAAPELDVSVLAAGRGGSSHPAPSLPPAQAANAHAGLRPTAAGMTVPQVPEITGYEAVAPTGERRPAAPGASLEPESPPTAVVPIQIVRAVPEPALKRGPAILRETLASARGVVPPSTAETTVQSSRTAPAKDSPAPEHTPARLPERAVPTVAAERSRSAEPPPAVHIGTIEIIVEAPPTAQRPRESGPAPDLTSRFYLRRL